MADVKGDILPKGEGLRRALRWLGEQRRESPGTPRGKLIDEAAMRFDLTPPEVDFLLQNWREP
jgi:hypothetical protein